MIVNTPLYLPFLLVFFFVNWYERIYPLLSSITLIVAGELAILKISFSTWDIENVTVDAEILGSSWL